MSKKEITMSLPPETAEKMGLPVNPDGQYGFSSWLEIAAGLTMASQNEVFADFNELERQMMSYHWAEIVAETVLNKWNDGMSLAAQTGLDMLVDADSITREQAIEWFSWFFYHYFRPKYDLLKKRGVTDADVAGFAKVLTPETVQWMTYEPITSSDGAFTPWEQSDAETSDCLFLLAAQSYAKGLSKEENVASPESESVVNF